MKHAFQHHSPAPDIPARAAFSLFLQKLRPVDLNRVREHLLRLDAADRRMRFGGTVSDRSIGVYCERIDWSRTTLLGAHVNGMLRGVAELQFTEGVHPPTAELAFSVERPFQDQGFGTALLRKALTVARNRAIREVYMTCLLENRKMQQVARKLEASLVVHVGEVEGCIQPTSATLLSLAEEAAMDGQALWRAVFEISAPVDLERSIDQAPAA